MDAITVCTIIGTAISLLAALGGLVTICIKIGEYSEKFKNLESCTKSFSDIISSLDKRLITVENILMIKHKGVADLFSAKHSPRSLNNIGEKVYRDMKGEEYIKKYKNLLFSIIDNENPKTALDVETAAFHACVNIDNDEAINYLKVFVYNYPTQQVSENVFAEVTLHDACFILSLPLRDMYLAEHPYILR